MKSLPGNREALFVLTLFDSDRFCYYISKICTKLNVVIFKKSVRNGYGKFSFMEKIS